MIRASGNRDGGFVVRSRSSWEGDTSRANRHYIAPSGLPLLLFPFPGRCPGLFYRGLSGLKTIAFSGPEPTALSGLTIADYFSSRATFCRNGGVGLFEDDGGSRGRGSANHCGRRWNRCGDVGT